MPNLNVYLFSYHDINHTFVHTSDESDEPDEDADLTQNDFNDAAGIERVDELYEKFLSRIRRGLHYLRSSLSPRFRPHFYLCCLLCR